MTAKAKGTTKKGVKKDAEAMIPVEASLGQYSQLLANCGTLPRTGTRSNSAAQQGAAGRFANIQVGVAPYLYSNNSKYNTNISIQDVILLTQMAYWNVPIFRNTIDLMTEFALSSIEFVGGNKESRTFFEVWAKKISLWSLTDMFFREYFRSGNVFLYKLYGEFPREQMRKLEQFSIAEAAAKIPLRYLLLNPYDIQVLSASNFIQPSYKKRLNDYEISAIISSNSPEDIAIRNAIPELRQLTGKKGVTSVEITLERERLVAVFYKKQDYEPLAVPMGFPVLDDIDWKLELKKIDRAISKTIQQAVLLITQGDEEMGPPSQPAQDAIRRIFENGSVGRVLIADYTTKAEFVIPQIGDILDPKKYEIVDRDIRLGLNNILFGDDKFASTSAKMDAFFKRLEIAREEFMIKFLIPEVEAISKSLNFKSSPTPRWKSHNFRNDSAVLSRVYTRLLELGAISPNEAINAIQNNVLPTPEQIKESQRELLQDKNEGYFQPLLNNKPEMVDENGRPVGSTGVAQTTQKITPIGQKSVASYKFSMQKIGDLLRAKDSLSKEVQSILKKKYKVKKLNDAQITVASEIVDLIVAAHEPEEWSVEAKNFVDNPTQKSTDIYNKVTDLEVLYGMTEQDAAILYHARAE